MLLGAHVPTSGGVAMAPGNGRSIEATAIQIFTRSQRQWKAKPMTGQESGAFRRALGGSGVKAVLSHASYLINLASVVPQFLALSRKTLAEELRRCHALGIPAAPRRRCWRSPPARDRASGTASSRWPRSSRA